MGDFVELQLSDGTSVLMEVEGTPVPPAAADVPPGWEAQEVEPTGRGGRRMVARAGTALEEMFTPVGAVLDSVHGAMSRMDNPPREMTVELGVKLVNGFQLGIVQGSGEANITMSATWEVSRAGGRRAAGASDPVAGLDGSGDPGPVPEPARSPE